MSQAAWSPDAAVPSSPPLALRLPPPEPSWQAAEEWVELHLGDLAGDEARSSLGFRGGETAAQQVLADFDVRGYATRRNQVWPRSARGASYLSPYIRHGLLSLPRVWAHVEGGPSRDVQKFRDELLWQEYARHLYARLGPALASPLRAAPAASQPDRPQAAWAPDMLCFTRLAEELQDFGWLPNQARMWIASHWAVHHGASWQEGEDRLYRQLIDGSRAANRLGWQWTVGTATGRAYGFSRWQVEKRAPGLCRRCERAESCPIQSAPSPEPLLQRTLPPELRHDPSPERTGGPLAPARDGTPERVWLTAESLGRDDPALAAHPGLPAVFVFDAPLLTRLRLSRRRLIFLAETLAELAAVRPLEIYRGAPEPILRSWPLAATFTPVPGWRRLSRRLDLAEIHPWPWLRRPHAASVASFSAWRKALGTTG